MFPLRMAFDVDIAVMALLVRSAKAAGARLHPAERLSDPMICGSSRPIGNWDTFWRRRLPFGNRALFQCHEREPINQLAVITPSALIDESRLT